MCGQTKWTVLPILFLFDFNPISQLLKRRLLYSAVKNSIDHNISHLLKSSSINQTLVISLQQYGLAMLKKSLHLSQQSLLLNEIIFFGVLIVLQWNCFISIDYSIHFFTWNKKQQSCIPKAIFFFSSLFLSISPTNNLFGHQTKKKVPSFRDIERNRGVSTAVNWSLGSVWA